MNKLAIVNKATAMIGKSGLKLKKYSPEILVVSGVVGVVASAVMACKSTLKVNAVVEDTKEKLDKIHEASEHGATAMGMDYTEEDRKKDLVIVYTQTAVEFAKLYGPAVILGGLSITAILASNNILRKRNVTLAAAYAALDRGFKDYRKRVVERFGESVDRELKYNIRKEKIETETVDPETGKKKKTKETIEVVNEADLTSPFSRFYDDGCVGWTKDPQTNLIFLRAEQNFANDRLKARGYLFLNEVYERLGFPTTKLGQSFGWVYNPDDENHKGDNYVDFGIYDIRRPKARDFVNGYERVILLDFNVDGNIVDTFEDFRH